MGPVLTYWRISLGLSPRSGQGLWFDITPKKEEVRHLIKGNKKEKNISQKRKLKEEIF